MEGTGIPSYPCTLGKSSVRLVLIINFETRVLRDCFIYATIASGTSYLFSIPIFPHVLSSARASLFS